MALDDEVVTDRRDVLSMIACAEDYGHDNQITRNWFKALLGGVLTDDEIEAYAREAAEGPQRSEEDYRENVERLRRFRQEEKLDS